MYLNPRKPFPKYSEKLNLTIISDKTDIAEEFIALSLHSGEYFVEAVKKYGFTEKGSKVVFEKWFLEYLELIGNFKIGTVITSGCAQTGKTLAHNFLLTYIIVHGKLNAAWFYNSRENRDANVPEQFIPIIDRWAEEYSKDANIKLSKKKDRETSSRYQVDGVTGIFSYVSTSKSTTSRDGLAKAGGAAVSFTANVLFLEERSQYPLGTADSLPRRLDASLIPTKPIRELGTPGAGQGIEKSLKECEYEFYPHYKCKFCNNIRPLNPYGCLLKKSDIKNPLGETVKSFLSISGRPVSWFNKDITNPIETAFIGCSVCGEELTEEVRLNAFYQCLKTGITLRGFLDSLPEDIPSKRLKVGVYLSPLVRRSESNLASEIIEGGITCVDPTDWIQQRLGWASENMTSSISMQVLERCINAPKPENNKRFGEIRFRIAGIDVGRSADYIIIIEYNLPLNYKKLSKIELTEQTIRNVLVGKDINRDDIPDILEKYQVDFGFIDNEPDRESASKICKKTVLQMCDQKPEFEKIIVKSTVEDGGNDFECWKYRNEKFITQTFEAFLLNDSDGNPIVRLPEEWNIWKTNNSERSPLRHITGVSKDPIKGWQRAKDHNDDIFFAMVHCEAAFYVWLDEYTVNSWLSEV